jgi:hypothetical protein
MTAIAILESIEARYGEIDRVAWDNDTGSPTGEDAALVFCTRFAAAFGRMIADPDLKLSALGFEGLARQYLWLDMIFSLSGFRGTDHLFALIADRMPEGGLNFSGAALRRMLAIRLTRSRFDLDFDEVWRAHKELAAIAFVNHAGSRVVLSSRGLEFRERLLEWLPARIDEVVLGSIALAKIQDLYMHCSYAFTPKKHAIKAGLIRQMRRACLDAGCEELPLPGDGKTAAARPTVIVVIERLGLNHSIHRTHGPALRSLRERFNVVWVGYRGQIGAEFQADYDELIPIPEGEFFANVRALTEEIQRRAPAVVFHVGIGMW